MAWADGTRSDLQVSVFGGRAVLAVSTKIAILRSCIDESPKGFGSIEEMQTLNFEVGARGSMDPLAPTRVKC